MKFKDISQKDALIAIKSLLKSGNLRKTDFSVWFNWKKVSPAAVITEHYNLIGKPIDRNTFDTTDAQRRLLELGFPIISNKLSDDFFTSKDLWSFEKMTERKQYDLDDEVDKNIKEYLYYVSWKKTKKWARHFEEEGWKVEDRASWNIQNKSKTGQGYKNYTWARIYPKGRKQDVICFTVGIDREEGLVYKVDIRKDKVPTHFSDWFYRVRGEKWPWEIIDKSELVQWNWDKLFEETKSYFEGCLDDYIEIEKKYFEENRLMRLAWNSNDWIEPSGHKWSKDDWDKTDTMFTEKYGFAYEDWFFNRRYEKDGYQYSYIKGADGLEKHVKKVDELTMFTIDPQTSIRYLVGSIKNVEIINGNNQLLDDIIPVFNQYHDETVEELVKVNAYTKHLENEPFRPNIRFKWDDLFLLNELIEAPNLNTTEYTRFNPYRTEKDAINEFSPVEIKSVDFQFNEGIGKNQSDYDRKQKASNKRVSPNHKKISESLLEFLKLQKGGSLSFEKTYVGTKKVDAVLLQNDKYTLFEIKTGSTATSNIRQAMGQLLEYAYLAPDVPIQKLVIASPGIPNIIELEYFKRLKEVIKVPLEYWAYDFENGNFRHYS